MTTDVSGRLSVRVAARKEEAKDIVSFELVPTDDGPLPAFSAGAHIDVHVDDGVTRQYSLCNDPVETHRYLIAILKDPNSRGGSRAMHERVRVGAVLSISHPKNHFNLTHGAANSLLLAGGIGVTPILCMAERLAVMNAPFEMHFCTRSRERTAFLDRIRASRFASQVHLHFDDEGPEQRFDVASRLAKPEPGTHLYVCGPKGFMDAVLVEARAKDWPKEQLHYEFFAADVASAESDESFEVQLASSGRTITVPKGRTVIQELRAVGVEIETSCEQGICGTCVTRVLEGIPHHKDLYFTPAEHAANDQFTPCCSRAKTPRLVLDL